MGIRFNPFTGNFDLTGPNITAFSVKGSVAEVADLSAIAAPAEEDAYVVIATGHLYVWTGSVWANLGPFRGPAGQDGEDAIAVFNPETNTLDFVTVEPGTVYAKVAVVTQEAYDAIAIPDPLTWYAIPE